ncbi:fungal-specific transcription factor domain protein [Xylona heveae TC161]|uniref:Fungal-specific transcription factor domain protein n=1 Tax=Xylona heveae (strain CBS 132557 / TC161) TaxID=1328760 RepID=A0A165I9P7_XYLHT|nr:fungal-specific transcription factor domain protein [Xylona heveae TC161]KZF24590.1 fungal-specific transcription factor domain protein [Xylona heveae TC161]
MRLSISCDACREAKVKCIHEGHPPCRRCQRRNRQACVLTDPRASPLRPRRDSERVQHKARSAPRAAVANSTVNRAAPTNDLQPTTPSNPIASLSASTIICACDTYRKKFPVANFLHYPSLIAEISANPSSVDPVFVASLFSLCARFLPEHHLEAGETYAEYARAELARKAFEAPSLYLAQSSAMMVFYEWGSGHPYKAWMYSGMATYMVQSLLRTADDSMEQNPDEFQASQIQYEQLVRTYWVCFAQDCELSSGARQHFSPSFRQISVPLPISDHDFNFGRRGSPRLMPANLSRDSPLCMKMTIDHGLIVVTRGFDISVRILRFANESRRGRTSSTTTDSLSIQQRNWQILKEELDEWRALQDFTLQYPATSVQAHVALGYGELFAYINLIYFMSILFLYRDQLLSSLKQVHESRQDRAIEHLFEAAQSIGGVLSALEASGAPIITPYSGFSAFVAAHVNMYGTVSPLRYPGGQERAEAEKKSNFSYLERLCKFWPVGHSWWRTVQEANKFYQSAKNNQEHVLAGDRHGHITLAGTLDEYGDIRSSRPLQGPSSNTRRRATGTEANIPPQGGQMDSPAQTHLPFSDQFTLDSHELEMLQWPFIDETWSSGFDTGLDSAWPNFG